MKIYVSKTNPRFFQETPIPVDLENWATLTVASLEDLEGKMWDGSKLIEDLERQALVYEALCVETRTERDTLIRACDWRVLPDQPVSQPWLDYRRALRDVPQQEGFPFEVVWPRMPDA